MFWLLFIFVSADLPEQIHIAATEVPGRLVFTWSTRTHTESQVKIFRIDGSCKTYNGFTRPFEMDGNKWKIHSVTIFLLVGMQYKYQVGSQLNFSEILNVKVPKNQEPSEVVFLGDFSFHDKGKKTWKAVEERFLQGSVESVVVLGDLAYNLHSKSGKNGDFFMNKVQTVASSVPFMVIPGNHEGFDGYYNFLNRFDMPGQKFFYSFTQGFIRFVGINTEFFFSEPEKLGKMREFLKDTLDRNVYDFKHFPWLVVFAHRPIYCQEKFKVKACSFYAKILRDQLLEMFRTYQVDLYVNAHVHNYQRSKPLLDGTARKFDFEGWRSGWTVYVTNGAAGADSKNTQIDWDGFGDWLEYGSDEHSYGVLNANKTHLEWKQFKSVNKELIDSLIIKKKVLYYTNLNFCI